MRKDKIDFKSYSKILLLNMKKSKLNIDKISTLLVGEPGTGKTAFVEFFSNLVGLPLVLIEVPHISEEHLINIPFLIIDKENKTRENESFTKDFKLVKANSVLYTKLNKLSPYTEEEHFNILNHNKILKEIYDDLKEEIDFVRKNFNSLLFLDEFYRARNIRITNILRTFLNGKIGVDDIPEGTFVVYASNMNTMLDQGLNEIPLNHQFKLLEFKTSTKDEWFKYIEEKYVHTSNPINEKVLTIFRNNILDSDLGFLDYENEVRISPRRLEQIVIYINNRYVQNNENGLKSFVKTNVSNYITNNQSTFNEKLNIIITELFEKTLLYSTSWLEELITQIEVKQSLGKFRQYTPCLCGKPGTGKTSTVRQMAKNQDMGIIEIDCSTLNPEDTLGIPNSLTNNFNDIEVFFTEPLLYSIIMKEYNKDKEKFKNSDREYNYILFLDEINRTVPAVFNSIRKLLLDKSLNEDYKLPKDIMIISALNPEGTGTIELTPHLKDVLDIIEVTPSFDKLKEHIKSLDFVKKESLSIGFDLCGLSLEIMESINDRFGSKTKEDGTELSHKEDNHFYITTIDNNVIYISQREMTSIISNYIYDLSYELKEENYNNLERYSEDEYDKYISILQNTFFVCFKETFDFICLKQDIEESEKNRTLEVIFNHIIHNRIDIFLVLKNVKSKINISLSEMCKNINYEIDSLNTEDGVLALQNYIDGEDNISEIINDYTKTISLMLDNEAYKSKNGFVRLYKDYAKIYKMTKQLNFNGFDYQLQDRLTKVFLYNYNEITKMIKSEGTNSYDILNNLIESNIFENELKECFVDDKATFLLG